jgi:hypothetical protein
MRAIDEFCGVVLQTKLSDEWVILATSCSRRRLALRT